jgi:hypothetical protein
MKIDSSLFSSPVVVEDHGQFGNKETASLIFDRGYSSSKLMAQAEEKGLKFLVRLRKKLEIQPRN